MPALGQNPVIGAEELRRAFIAAGGLFNAEMRNHIRYFATPVARDAEILARATIPNIGVAWAQMRTGATGGKGTVPMVYVAPVQRGTRIRGKRRPKFADLLLRRAMQPALERNRARILSDIDALLARLERKFNRR